MHVGKNYPFHPVYWATECIFWPGFVPWKTRCFNLLPNVAPWDALDTHFDAISEAGIAVPDATQMSWHWSLDPPSTATDLSISVEMIEFSGVNYCRFNAVLRTSGVLTAEAWCYQSFPQRSCTFLTGDLWDVNHPVHSGNIVNLNLVPATFAEGGSPFPLY